MAPLLMLALAGNTWAEPGPVAVPAPEAATPVEKSNRKWDVTLSIGLPYPAQLGLSWEKSPSLSYVVAGTYLPLPISANTLYFFDTEAGLKYKPDPRGAFYVTGLAGFHSINYQGSFNLGSLAPGTNLAGQPIVAGINSFYLSPTVGWLWKKKSGFLIGFDLGLEVPVIAWGGASLLSTDPSLASLGSSLSSSSSPVLSHYASLVIPRLTLIRLGWEF